MALSGSDNFTNTRDDIINAALRKTGQLAEGETATAQQVNDAAKDLERMVKLAQAAGLHLWKYEEMVLFLVADQQSYDLGTTTSENWVKKSDLVSTTLSAAASSTDTAMTVTSITGISDGDVVGVVVDDNTIHWTTVNGAPSGSTVTLTTGLDDDAASGNALYAYTNKATRPLQVTHGRAQVSTTSEIELTILAREDYFRLSNKAASGTVIQVYYNPRLTNGKLYVWPTAEDERVYLNLTTQISIQDFDAADNNPDFPAEWHEALVWNLAKRLIPEYGIVDQATITMITGLAQETWQLASEFDAEEADVIFAPDFE